MKLLKTNDFVEFLNTFQLLGGFREERLNMFKTRANCRFSHRLRRI